MSAPSKTKSVTILGWIFIGLGALGLFTISMFVVGIPFIIIGIGILKRKKWSRNAGIFYEWLQVVFSIGAIGAACWLGFTLDSLALTMVGFVGILNLGLSSGLIYWLNRPKVKEEIID